MKIKVKRVPHSDHSLPLPVYAKPGDSGFDVRVDLHLQHYGQQLHGHDLLIPPHSKVMLHTGLCYEVPEGYELQIRPRSGIAANTWMLIHWGTLDAGYRGELKVIVYNMGDKPEYLHHGDRIAQGVIAPVIRVSFEEADELSDTERGSNGFGSTSI